MYLPQGWGTPYHVSPAQLGHSYLLLSEAEQRSEGKDFGGHLSPSFLHLPAPICSLIISLIATSCSACCRGVSAVVREGRSLP